MRRALLLVPAALAVAVLAACGPDGAPRPDGAVRHAAVDGSGTACTEHRPCALDEAVTGASGGTVRVAPGEYGDLELRAPGGGALARAARVVVEPAGGGEVVLGKLTLELPATTWRGVTITGGVYLDEAATGSELDSVHVDGSGVFVHADDVKIRASTIENGTSIDGIQIAGATGVLVEHSIVRDFAQGPDSEVHADCVQLFDTSRVVLRGNYLGRCDNAAVIFSPGQDAGIRDVLLEGNRLQGCVVESERCSRGTVLDLRAVTGIRDVVVRNNTMLDGSVLVERLDGLVFDRNIVGYASNCDLPMTNSIVASWNTGTCDRPEALGRDGNREGEVRVRDREGGDLAPVDPRDAAIEPEGPADPAPAGFGGARLAPDEAGAGG